MRWSKRIDKKIRKMGFIKEKENKFDVVYTRYNESFNYTQIIEICRKSRKNKQWILHSYQQGINSEGFNNGVGLTGREIKLFYKKAIQKWGRVK